MSSIKRSHVVAVCLAALIFLPGAASADIVINGDLHGRFRHPDYMGQGVYADPGNDYWNSLVLTENANNGIFEATFEDLIASDGTTGTTADLYLTYSSSHFDEIGSYITDIDYDFATSGNDPALVQDLAFRGLEAGGVYDIYLYTTTHNRGTIFKLGGVDKLAQGTDGLGTYVEGEHYVVFERLTADGSGEIAGTWAAEDKGWGWQYAEFAGFQLVQAVAELVWDNAGNNGQWSTDNWAGGPSDWPDATVEARVNNGATVTVATAGQAALSLKVDDGAVAVATDADLSISNSIDVAADGGLSVQAGGTLNADFVKTVGTVTFDAGALGTVNTLNVNGGTATVADLVIPAVNVGGGVLNTSADAGALTVTAGTVNTTGPLAATTVTVSDGALNTAADLTAHMVEVNGGTVSLLQSGNLNVSDMEVVSGGVVNTGTNVVEVSDRLKLGTMTLTVEGEGDSFQASGSDLLSDTAPRTITVGGGVLDVNVPGEGGGAGGTVINADLNGRSSRHYTGQGAFADLGYDHWNNLEVSPPETLYENLTASDGTTVTAVDFYLTCWNSWIDELGGYITDVDYDYATSLLDPGMVEAFAFSGLDSGGRYDLYLYTTTHNRGTIFTIGHVDKLAPGTEGLGGYVEDENYVVFRGLTADPDGEIDGLWAARPGENPYAEFAGFQLVEMSTVLSDINNTSIVVTEDAQITTNATDVTAGDLTITNLPAPADPTTLTLSDAEFNFANVTTAHDSTIVGSILVRSDLNIGDSPGVLNVEGGFELTDDAVYHCEISAWDSTGVDDPWEPSAGVDPVNDQLQMVSGDASLGGTLNLTVVTKLHPPKGDGSQWFGEQTRTIVTAEGDNSVMYTFTTTPTPLPEDFGAAQWGEGHIGRGVFLTRESNGGENDVPGVSYEIGGTKVHLFQAIDGDTNGNAILDTADIFSILGAGSFLKPGEWDWTEGDFDGDQDVDTTDIFAILATGKWGNFAPYYPEPGKASSAKGAVDAVVDLIVNAKTGEVSVDTNGAEITGYVISSDSGALTGDEAATQFLMSEQTSGQIADMLPLGKAFAGVHDLGSVLDGDGSDLTLTYTLAGQAGVFQGNVKVVPEPGTLAMLLAAATGLLLVAVRRRRNA